VILTWGHCAWGLCVSYNLKDNMTHPDNLALMKKIMASLVLVCANTKRNYTHLHDPDAFFARPEHSVDPCHVSVEFSTRPVPFKLIFLSCLLCLRLTTDFFLSDFRLSLRIRLAFTLCMLLSQPTLSPLISPTPYYSAENK
jgi:hypothetical protein